MLDMNKGMALSQVGFAGHRRVFDNNNKAAGAVFLPKNDAFKRRTGFKTSGLLNKSSVALLNVFSEKSDFIKTRSIAGLLSTPEIIDTPIMSTPPETL